MPYSIYVLKDPRDGSIHYVGRTKSKVKARFCTHLWNGNVHGDGMVPPVSKWINSLGKDGVSPIIETLFEIDDALISLELEESIIGDFKQQGHDLKNIARSNGCSMTISKKLGISQGWLWKIYNGYAYPGKSSAAKLEAVTGKPRRWWTIAKLSNIQRVLDAIE